MSEHGHGPTDDGHEKKSGSGTGFLLMIPIVLIGFILIKFLFSSGKKEDGGNNRNISQTEQSSNKSSGTWIVVKHVTVKLGKEYGEVYHILSIDGFNFDGATQPYCSMNNDGAEACGQAGEDISNKLPKDSKGNTGLRFKSSNGETGELTIIVSELK